VDEGINQTGRGEICEESIVVEEEDEEAEVGVEVGRLEQEEVKSRRISVRLDGAERAED
jgi:hypothetical protein